MTTIPCHCAKCAIDTAGRVLEVGVTNVIRPLFSSSRSFLFNLAFPTLDALRDCMSSLEFGAPFSQFTFNYR